MFDKRRILLPMVSFIGMSAALRSSRRIRNLTQQIGANPFSLVDPQLLSVFNRNGTLSSKALRTAVLQTFPGPYQPGLTVRYISGPVGAPPVRIRIANPFEGGIGHPAYLHIHGGGYTSGFANASMAVARACSCVVVSVDYRLAPRTQFPGSLEDNYATLQWMYENAEELGIDRDRIAIGGESAGGGHAAALAIAARDRNGPPILFQVLIYPMLDDRTGSSRPRAPKEGIFVWTPSDNRRGWAALLGQNAGLATAPYGSVPARVDDLSALPPAWIGVGTLDLFIQENQEYAKRLKQAGVPVQFELAPRAFHGFDLLNQDATIVSRFTDSWQSALKHAFAACGAS